MEYLIFDVWHTAAMLLGPVLTWCPWKGENWEGGEGEGGFQSKVKKVRIALKNVDDLSFKLV